MKFQIGSHIEKIQSYIQLETYLLLWVLILIAYLFYKLFLKKISLKRHTNLRARFKKSTRLLFISSILSVSYWFFHMQDYENLFILKIENILAFVSLLVGTFTVIRLAQIYAYLYLFFMNMSVGIPRLIANLFTVIFSLFVFSFLASEIFSINLSAMLATSAVFSLVLGLALQDTLGNLFSGVAVQIGQPFLIGDWVEICHESQKWVGQIQEITWRATFLNNFSEELLMIPNKIVGQSQITIYSSNAKNVRHVQAFRIRFGENTTTIKQEIMLCLKNIEGVLQDPAPRILLIDTTESWITLKVFYSISDFSLKYRLGDQVIDQILQTFQRLQIELAHNKIEVTGEADIKSLISAKKV